MKVEAINSNSIEFPRLMKYERDGCIFLILDQLIEANDNYFTCIPMINDRGHHNIGEVVNIAMKHFVEYNGALTLSNY